jgi:hypothetical protein
MAARGGLGASGCRDRRATAVGGIGVPRKRDTRNEGSLGGVL